MNDTLRIINFKVSMFDQEQFTNWKVKAMKNVQKENLPTKVCPVCHRSFSWRKKWERDWDNVTYCSKRCRKGKQV